MHTHASVRILSPAKRMMITITPPTRVSVQAGVAESSGAQRLCSKGTGLPPPARYFLGAALSPWSYSIFSGGGGCLVTQADSDTRQWLPGFYSIISFCSENVGPEDSQPPAEDRSRLPCPLSGTGPGTQTAPVMPRCCRDSRVWARRLPSTLSPMSTAPISPPPVRPQMAMDPLGLVLGRISCKEFWLCVCLFFSQNETFYRFIYVRGIQIAAVRVYLMLIALIANPLFIDSASNSLCLVLR